MGINPYCRLTDAWLARFICNGMTANAQAPRNGTAEMKPPCSFANPPRLKAARVPLSRGVCFAFVQIRTHTLCST